jgi:hypothetical protein
MILVGPCSLHEGDCANVLAKLKDATCTLVLSDIPYKPRKLSWQPGNHQQMVLDHCLRISTGPVLWIGVGTPGGDTHFSLFRPKARFAHGPWTYSRRLWGWRIPETWKPVASFQSQHLLEQASFQLGPHTSPTPVSLADAIIQATGATSVVDPFMGTGWVGMACALRGIPFVGIEINPTTFSIAVDRIEWALREREAGEG